MIKGLDKENQFPLVESTEQRCMALKFELDQCQRAIFHTKSSGNLELSSKKLLKLGELEILKLRLIELC